MRVDVGVGISTLGYPEYYGVRAQVDTRFALVRPPSLDAGVDLTLAPALGGHLRAGTSLGVAIPLVSWVRLVPEVSVSVMVKDPSSRLVHAGVGLLLGGYTASARPEEKQP